MNMCSVSEIRFHDAENFETAVKGAQIDPCPLSKGSLPSEIVRIDYGPVCLDLVTAEPAMLYKGKMPEDCYTLSFVLKCDGVGHSFNFGTDFSSGYMGFFSPGASLDATNPAGSENALLTVGVDVFHEALALYFPEMSQEVLVQGAGMNVGSLNQEHLRSLLESIKRVVQVYEDQKIRDVVCHELGRFLLPTFLSALREGVSKGGTQSNGRVLSRYHKFCDVRDYISDHIKEPIFVEDLCKSACLSERGVENLFKDLAGTSPMAFLRLQRLQSVHHALRNADPCSGKVKELALAAGFLHMGHFSQYYQAMFGESAGQTLAEEAS